jgi:integrase
MAIRRACLALEVPVFAPHDLRRRRISLLHKRGLSWAEIGEHVGQTDIATTANTYTKVLLEYGEVDYAKLLG